MDIRKGFLLMTDKIQELIDKRAQLWNAAKTFLDERTDKDGKDHVYSAEPFKVIGNEGNIYCLECSHCIQNAGSFKVAYRMFPKNDDLPHRQDFCYVKWYN